MANMRSPNYPALGLSEAIQAAQMLWDKEKRTPVDIETIAHAWGYSSVSGRVRSKLGAIRKYGLVEDVSEGTRISDLGVRILHSMPSSEEQANALKEAALRPELFRELYGTHRESSEKGIGSYLIVKKGFSEKGAREATKAFRDTIDVANLGSGDYTPLGESASASDDIDDEADVRGAAQNFQMASGPPRQHTIREVGRVFSWPLSKGVTVEVRFTGGEVQQAHIDMLTQYLAIAKAAIGTDDDEQKAD